MERLLYFGPNRPIFFKLSKPRTSKAMAASACHGALAQLGERGLCKPEVRGSIPLRSTIDESDEHLRVFVFLYREEAVTVGLLSVLALISPLLFGY